MEAAPGGEESGPAPAAGPGGATQGPSEGRALFLIPLREQTQPRDVTAVPTPTDWCHLRPLPASARAPLLSCSPGSADLRRHCTKSTTRKTCCRELLVLSSQTLEVSRSDNPAVMWRWRPTGAPDFT